MLRCDLEITADVVGYQLFNIFRVFDGQVITQPRGNDDFFNALQATNSSIEFDQRVVVGIEVFTNKIGRASCRERV